MKYNYYLNVYIPLVQKESLIILSSYYTKHICNDK